MNDSIIKTETEKLLWAASDCAHAMSLSRSFFYSLYSAGRIAPLPLDGFGKRKLWRADELKSWVEHNCPSREQWGKIWKAQRKAI